MKHLLRLTSISAACVALGFACWYGYNWYGERGQPAAIPSATSEQTGASVGLQHLTLNLSAPADAIPHFGAEGYAMSISPSWKGVQPSATATSPVTWNASIDGGMAIVTIDVVADNDVALADFVAAYAASHEQHLEGSAANRTAIVDRVDGSQLGRVEGTQQIVSEGSNVTVKTVSYIAVRGTKAVVATVSLPPDLWDRDAVTFEAYLATLTIM